MLRDLIENGSVIEIVATFIALALIVASILCIFFFMWGGISFILSAGNEEKIKKAIHTIRYAIVGLFVTFLGFFVVQGIAKILDIPFELDFSTIIALMQDILTSLGS